MHSVPNTDTLSGILRDALAKTSPTGINLKKLAQTSAPKEYDFLAFILWLNICGFPPFKTSDATYTASPRGFAQLLRTNPVAYNTLETAYKKTLLQWHPTARNSKTEWLNPPNSGIQAIHFKNNTTFFAKTIQPRANTLRLKNRVTTEFDTRLLDHGLDPNHPLSLLLSGFSSLSDLDVPMDNVESITPETDEPWQIRRGSLLYMAANNILAHNGC